MFNENAYSIIKRMKPSSHLYIDSVKVRNQTGKVFGLKMVELTVISNSE